jgi:ElaB/YqjD/DUF883 family membrane-anchored ribosome-binding protein
MADSASMGAAKAPQKVGEALAELGSQAGEIAQAQFERLKVKAAELVHDGRERVQDMEQSLERYIADHPIKSMLIAASVGLVLGRCILR